MNKELRAMVKNHIRIELKTMIKDNPETARCYPWNNIVENYIWNRLKSKGVLKKYPSHLYDIIRRIILEPEIHSSLKELNRK